MLLVYVGGSNSRYGFRFFGEGEFQVELMRNGGVVEMSVQTGCSISGVSPDAVKEALEEVIAHHREPSSHAADNGVWGVTYEHDWTVPRGERTERIY